MKAKLSPLQLLDFAIMQLEFDFLPTEDVNDDPVKYFGEYELDVDFGIFDDDELLRVFIKAKINEDKSHPGYRIIAEAACMFKFNQVEILSDDVKNNLQGYSSIYIALNSLRGLISNFTANAPFGRYVLPSIDLNDLIQKKQAVSKQKKSLHSKQLTAKKVSAKKTATKKGQKSR